MEQSLQIEKEYSQIKEQYQANYEIISSESFKKNENSVQIWRNTHEIRTKLSRQLGLKNLIPQFENSILNSAEEYQRLVSGYLYIKNEKVLKENQVNTLAEQLSGQKKKKELTIFLQDLQSLKQYLENEKYFKEKITKSKEIISQILEKISKSKEKIT